MTVTVIVDEIITMHSTIALASEIEGDGGSGGEGSVWYESLPVFDNLS